jgi:thiamine biosynthesis lipoprotein
MLHRREFRAMGSKVLAIVDGVEEPSTLADVPVWFEEWEQVLSRFRSDSELTRLNVRAGSPSLVGEVLWDVYMAAVDAEHATGGLVTPLILEALLYAGYDQSFDLLQPIDKRGPQFSPRRDVPNFLERPIHQYELKDVVADPAQRSLCLPRGALLDLGGVAKGWAAQQAALRLRRCGPVLVSAGGDISVSGPRAGGEPWGIDVEDPFNQDAAVETIYVDGGGVATSGRDRRHWMRNGMPQHHIIDPRSGLPATTDVLTATVIARSTVEAEAIAKAVLISGSVAGLDWLDSDEGRAGLLILDNGQRLYSRHLVNYL